jgi:hypothetical protein
MVRGGSEQKSYETVSTSEASLAEPWVLRRLAEGYPLADARTARLMPRCHTTINGCTKCNVKSASYSSFYLFREPGSLLLRRLEKRQSQFEYGLSVFMFHGLVH